MPADGGGASLGSSPQPIWIGGDDADDVALAQLRAVLGDALGVLRRERAVAGVEDGRGRVPAAGEALLDQVRDPGRLGVAALERAALVRRERLELGLERERDEGGDDPGRDHDPLGAASRCEPCDGAHSARSMALQPPAAGRQQRIERAVLQAADPDAGAVGEVVGELERVRDRRRREQLRPDERERPVEAAQRVGEDRAGAQRAEAGDLGGGLRRHLAGEQRRRAAAVIASAVFGCLVASAAHAAVVHGETWSGRALPGWRLASGAAVRP